MEKMVKGGECRARVRKMEEGVQLFDKERREGVFG